MTKRARCVRVSGSGAPSVSCTAKVGAIGAFGSTSLLAVVTIADPFSSLTHLVGALVFAALAPALLRRSGAAPSARVCLAVFAASAVLLLTASGAYHLAPRGTAWRDMLQRLDHAAIFLLIAGTCSCGHGLFFHGFWRWGMVTIFWVVGVAGLAIKLLFFEAISEGIGLAIYLGLGWLGLLTIGKLALAGRYQASAGLAAGSVVYTAGALAEFYGHEALSFLPSAVSPHDLFHIAVLGGIGVHWRLFQGAPLAPLSLRP